MAVARSDLMTIRPFTDTVYSGHIEFIRFQEYYGMRTLMYISLEKGDHYLFTSKHGTTIFFPLQSFSRKT